ncbi:MAG: hypothetical protein KI790_06850 [Cyclobacteriaceae bacterium]|nr:hypothetical protein [Cyclobacteriaceae bacterium HetDA_MAG_MS6]
MKRLILSFAVATIAISTISANGKTDGEEDKKEVFIDDILTLNRSSQDLHAVLDEITEDVFQLSVFHKGVTVNIKIIDEAGNIYYDNSHSQKSNFTQKFDLSNLYTGDLEMVVSTNKSILRKSLN